VTAVHLTAYGTDDRWMSLDYRDLFSHLTAQYVPLSHPRSKDLIIILSPHLLNAQCIYLLSLFLSHFFLFFLCCVFSFALLSRLSCTFAFFLFSFPAIAYNIINRKFPIPYLTFYLIGAGGSSIYNTVHHNIIALRKFVMYYKNLCFIETQYHNSHVKNPLCTFSLM